MGEYLPLDKAYSGPSDNALITGFSIVDTAFYHIGIKVNCASGESFSVSSMSIVSTLYTLSAYTYSDAVGNALTGASPGNTIYCKSTIPIVSGDSVYTKYVFNNMTRLSVTFVLHDEQYHGAETMYSLGIRCSGDTIGTIDLNEGSGHFYKLIESYNGQFSCDWTAGWTYGDSPEVTVNLESMDIKKIKNPIPLVLIFTIT